MTQNSNKYRFTNHQIVKSDEFGYIGKLKTIYPECPKNNFWLEHLVMPAIKAEHVRMPWYDIQLLDGTIETRPQADLLFVTTDELFDMLAKNPDDAIISETSDDESIDDRNDNSSESSDDESNTSSDSESHSESDKSTQTENKTETKINNEKTCEYIIKVMLTPAELLMIGNTKPVVSFTMNNKSTTLTTNGNPYNYPLVYLYQNK